MAGPPADIPRESSERLYSGPYVAGAGGPAGARWVWVANGIRPSGQVFAPPRPLRDPVVAAMDRLPEDEATIDRAIESWRNAAYGYDDADPFAAYREDDEGDDNEGEDTPAASAVVSELVAVPGEEGVEVDVAQAEVRVLGPVEVTGWQVPPERAVVTELACYLALHGDRAIPGDELRVAFRPDEEQETSAKTLRTYMSLLRRALGPDLVPTGAGGGYHLSPAVTADWHRFRGLTGPAADALALRDALALIRGRPFAGVPAGTFGWVYAELLVSDMEAAIAGAARRLAEGAMAAGDLDTAAWATRQGLIGVPADTGLWRLHLAVAAQQGPAVYERARRDAEAALGADAGEL
ncbi:MAG TPA: hypothetical protein VHB02_15490 [Acidimicrobiales bacterium]|nr:hypothetical protein [Acidimicrobiales bacterium]